MNFMKMMASKVSRMKMRMTEMVVVKKKE